MIKLSNAQDAIKQAHYDISPLANPELAMTDPLFWQALGKARGWRENFKAANAQGDGQENNWGFYATKWFETRLSNGDEQAFWQSLP